MRGKWNASKTRSSRKLNEKPFMPSILTVSSSSRRPYLMRLVGKVRRKKRKRRRMDQLKIRSKTPQSLSLKRHSSGEA